MGEGTFTVVVQNGQDGNAELRIRGGRVSSADLRIDCGVGAGAQLCSADFAAGETVVLRATPSGDDPSFTPPRPYLFLGWAGDCTGEGDCTLAGNSDKYVVATFAGERTSHPNYSDPAVHGPAFVAFAAGSAGALRCTDCHGGTLLGQGIAASCSSCHPRPTGGLASAYFARSEPALAVVLGDPYDMRAPGFYTDATQHRWPFAYKVLSALNMLGYETRDGMWPDDEQQVRALARFQRTNGFAASPLLTREVLLELDRLLALREPVFGARGERFVSYEHMQPLTENMVTVPFVAMLYGYPIDVLPPALHLDEWEMAQCVAGQCVGFIHDATGADWGTFPIDITQDYRVVGAYYDPFRETARLTSAMTNAHTVLHEYAHYLDGAFLYHPRADQPHYGIVNTLPFYDVSIDAAGLTSTMPRCVTPRSTAQADFISYYAFASLTGYAGACPAGQYSPSGEDFAESFATYVVAGRRFRDAAAANPALARKYAILRDTVFGGVEYDTDASLGVKGPGCATRELYLGCDEDFVWSGEMAAFPSAIATSIEVASLTSAGGQTSHLARNYQASASETGRYVAFWSDADDLVPGDSNGVADIFVRDRLLGATTRVSVAADGAEADGESYNPVISGDGRFVAFTSAATNLVADDANGVGDVFVHDRVLGGTARVSVATGGAEANGASGNASVSWNGRAVSFVTDASNFVPGDPRPGVFVRDVLAGTTTRVSGPGSAISAISPDGRFVAHASDQVYLHDRASGTDSVVSVATDGTPAAPSSTSYWLAVSSGGRHVAFVSAATNLVPGDTNLVRDVFVRDRVLGQTARVNVTSDGSESNGELAGYPPSISSDGRYVAFTSAATNLYAGDTNTSVDAFVHDRATGSTARVATPPVYTSDTGAAGVVLSGDGRVVAFETGTRLVDPDLNAGIDVYAAPNPLLAP